MVDLRNLLAGYACMRSYHAWERKLRILLGVTLVSLSAIAVPAHSSPWAEVGDAQLRSDVDLLAAAGVVDNITTQWPIPWAGLLDRLNENNLLEVQPSYIRAAAKRVLAKGEKALDTHGVRFSAKTDVTNLPSVIRGFDAMGRQNSEEQFSGDFVDGSTAARLSIGARSTDTLGPASIQTTQYLTQKMGTLTKDHQTLVLDDSYVAQRIGNAVIYGGYITHWWGPGWISALSLSNNARPLPQIGISRIDTAPFKTPWLSWIGPWQMEFIVGVLDGPRLARNTTYDGLRLTINPLPGVEIGINRTDEMCGTGHPCQPVKEYFNFQNNNANPDSINGESQIDVRYSNIILKTPFEFYMSIMNEDTNPIIHSVSSHQFGASAWIPVGRNVARLTAEYTDTVPTANIFGGATFYGDAYNDYKYTDGMRYRGQTLGFSLDSDSRLASLQASIVNSHGITWTLTWDHANISDSQNGHFNIVTTSPVAVNLGEAKLTIPMDGLTLGLAARMQDDQPQPQHGFAAAGEMSLKVTL
jgi:hypothetical protein